MTYYAVGTTATTVPSSSSSRNGTAAQNSNSLPSFLASADGIDQVENNPYALALAFVPLMTIFGNALVILAVCRDKSLRTVTNLLIMSLAISDLLVALCVMFFAVYYEWNSFVWDLGPTLCNLYIGADVACSTASILNLLAISIDRYIAISHPLAYCQIGTNSRAYVSIALVWGVSISVAIPLAFGANHIESEHECAFTNPVFMISSSVLSFFLPCLAMIALYAVVFRRLRERESARTARKRHGALSGTETALIANALMGGARMARQIARSHLKDQLLLELSIQTSSFPTASRSEEEDEEEDEEDEYNDDDDEEEGTEPSESAGRRGAARRGHRRHNANSKGNNNSSSSSRRCLVTALQLHGQLAEEAQQQSRRPTIGLMMNGAMPFPMAPMNPLQLPSTAMTEAERRVRGWRRKRTLRLMRRCNTLPSTVMQRQNTTTTTPHQQGTTQMANARGESIDTKEHRDKQADATKCQKQVHRHQHHHQRGEPPTRPKSAMFNRGTDANGALRDAKDEGSGGAECVLHHQNTVDYVGENVLLQKHDATAEDANAKEKKEAPKGGEVATTQHGRQSRCLPCPPSPTPIHLCNSFGDELKECFPFIDQSEQQQQQQKHKDHNNKCAFPPDAVGNCSTSAAEAFHDQQQSFSCCPFPLSSDEIRRCVVLPNTTTAEATDPSYSFHCAAFKRHHRNGKNGTARRTPEMTKEREKECHGNGQLVGHFGIRRTHSERHPANLTLRHRSKKQLIRQLSVDGRCTACAGWVAVVGRDDNNNRNNNFHYDNNNYHNESNNAPNWIGNNECANDTNAAVPSAMKSNMVTVQEAKETPPMAKDGAYSFDAALALCNGGRDTPLPQRQQQQEQKRRKQCGTMLARFIQWTRGQRRVIAEFGIGRGPRLVEVIESATTVGIISAVDHRNKSMGRGGGVRRSVRISSRSPPGRHANQRQNSTQRTTDDCCSVTHAVVAAATPADHYDDHSAHGHFGHGGEGDQEEGDVDQSPEEWNDAGGCDSSAALSSSYRLLLGSNNNCCRPDTDTDPRRDSGGSVMERFSTSRTGNGPYDDESLRNVQNGTVPRRNGGCCQRASTVTGVPPKKTSCASSTFSSSPLRYIRLAFRRSLVPIVEEGRKPSRALLKRATRQMRREQKATVTLAVVLAVFLCCWVPFFALHLSNAICLLSGGVQCVHLLATFLSTWLGFLNSSLNPLIYTVFDKRFRKAFRNLLGCTVAGPRSAVVATGGGRRGKRPRG